jgi:XrtJ-associated TM-motif-TM protein
MIRKRYYILSALAFISLSTLLRAQISGCDDSPEAPTDILMLVGSIGMFYGSSVVMKLIRRKR